MKRKLICTILAGAAVCTVTGCGTGVPELSEEQSAVIAEYAAGKLLKYDTNYTGKVVSDQVINEQMAREEMFARNAEEYSQKIQAEKTREEQEKADSGQEGAGNAVVEPAAPDMTVADSAEFLGIAPLSLSYQGYEVRSSYPDGAEEVYFAMDATEGKKLLVLKFLIQNPTQEDVQADIFSTGARFKISVNGGDYKNALATMLTNDLSTYSDIIPAGAAGEAVLVMEVEEAEAFAVDSAAMTVKKGEETVEIALN